MAWIPPFSACLTAPAPAHAADVNGPSAFTKIHTAFTNDKPGTVAGSAGGAGSDGQVAAVIQLAGIGRIVAAPVRLALLLAFLLGLHGLALLGDVVRRQHLRGC